jgi:adenylate cyclase
MALERERKFLVKDYFVIPLSECIAITQIYIVDREDHSLRIRKIMNNEATICYKYYLDDESKEEHEYPFPIEEANRILENKEYYSLLEKLRFVKDGWDVDYYPNLDLMVAEYEFSDDNPLPDPLPDWIDKEVTGLPEFTNPVLAKKCYE